MYIRQHMTDIWRRRQASKNRLPEKLAILGRKAAETKYQENVDKTKCRKCRRKRTAEKMPMEAAKSMTESIGVEWI